MNISEKKEKNEKRYGNMGERISFLFDFDWG